ncbi:hypothetical protein RJ641_036521 [Dillenia turbinata]|uniref:Uncharacterized protein n=1 Tax=Dillenia turbinata TaxID=194707 RepID=A0AAN8VUG0_9MAGN
MKQLIRRLSRVADSSHYCLLRSNSSSCPSTRSMRAAAKLRRSSSASVPEGCLPVYVGDEMERQAESEPGILGFGGNIILGNWALRESRGK